MDRVVTIPIGPIFSGGSCRGIIHVIEKGDTLYLLSRRYHVSVSNIMYANPYVNVYNLQIGDELCIPTGMPQRPPRPMQPQPPMRPSRPMQPQPPMRPMPRDMEEREAWNDRDDWDDREDWDDRNDRDDWDDRNDRD